MRQEVVVGVSGLVRVLLHGRDLLRRLAGGKHHEDAGKSALGEPEGVHQLHAAPVGRLLRQLAAHLRLGRLLGIRNVRSEHIEGAVGLYEREEAHDGGE